MRQLSLAGAAARCCVGISAGLAVWLLMGSVQLVLSAAPAASSGDPRSLPSCPCPAAQRGELVVRPGQWPERFQATPWEAA